MQVIFIQSNVLSLLLNFDIIYLYEFKEKKENNIYIRCFFRSDYDFCNAWFFVNSITVYFVT